jgi:hypothetical protein
MGMRDRLLSGFLLLPFLVFPAFGQGGFTTVSGTITDPNGIPWSGGTVSAQFITPGGTAPTLNGQPFTSTTASGLLGPGGSFTMRLGDNGVIACPTSPCGTWQFTISIAPGVLPPAGKGPQSFTVTTAINCGTNTPATCTANAMTITSTLAPVPALSFTSGGGLSGMTAGQVPIAATASTVTSSKPIQGSADAGIMGAGSITGGLATLLCTDSNGGATTAGCPTSVGLVTAGLVAQYPMTEGTGTTLVDASGNGNNATFCGGAQAPTWISAAPVGGLQFTGSSNQCVNLPAVLNTVQTIQIFVGFQSNTSATIPYGNNTQVLVGGSGTLATSLDFALQQIGMTNGGYHLDSLNHSTVAFLSVAQGIVNGNAMVSLTMPGSDLYYLNGTQLPISQTGNSIGAQSGGNLLLGTQVGGGPLPYTGQMYYALFYSTALTAAQVAQNANAVQTIVTQRGQITPFFGGTVTDFSDQVVTDGDSITTNAVPQFMPGYLLFTSPLTNVLGAAFSGDTCINDIQSAPVRVDPAYRPGALRNTVTLMCGSNQQTGGVAAVIADMRGYCTARHLIGWKCIVVTMLDRATISLYHDQLNAAVEQLWPTFADGIADIAANVHLGADGANANVTYFGDGIHPSNYSSQFLLVPALVHAIDRAWGNSSSSGNYNVYNGTGTSVGQFVQSVSTGNVSGTTTSVSFSTGTNGFNTTAGNFLFLDIICQQGCTGLSITSVADGADTFNLLSPLVTMPGGGAIAAYYAMNIAGGARTVTVTWSGAAVNVFLMCNEYSGVATAAALDVTSVYATGATAAMTSANITTTAANELLIGVGGIDQTMNASVFSAGTGFTMRNQSSGDAIEDQITGAAGTYNATMNLTSACCNWGIAAAAFKTQAATTTTYNLLDVDSYAECNPTGGNVALNLPDASIMTGQSITIKNIQTAGANTCTINGITPLATGVAQQIDGAASFTLANKATATFKSKLTFTGVAGTNLSPVSNWVQVNF